MKYHENFLCEPEFSVKCESDTGLNDDRKAA